MNDYPIIDLVTLNAHVTPHVTSDHNVPDMPPLCRRVESLVKVSFESECRNAYLARNPKILVAFIVSCKSPKFRITSNPGSHQAIDQRRISWQ